MKVFDAGSFSVYVYSNEVNQSHHLPHCHIRWPDGNAVILLPTLKQIVGPEIPKGWRRKLIDNLDDICKAWDKCNPEKTVNE